MVMPPAHLQWDELERPCSTVMELNSERGVLEKWAAGAGEPACVRSRFPCVHATKSALVDGVVVAVDGQQGFACRRASAVISFAGADRGIPYLGHATVFSLLFTAS